ncbi:MAG: YfiR family protein [Verrucomicrobiia bacterium]
MNAFYLAKNVRPELVAQLRGAGGLTVGGSTKFWKEGGMIQIREVNEKARFASNLKQARSENIQIVA